MQTLCKNGNGTLSIGNPIVFDQPLASIGIVSETGRKLYISCCERDFRVMSLGDKMPAFWDYKRHTTLQAAVMSIEESREIYLFDNSKELFGWLSE